MRGPRSFDLISRANAWLKAKQENTRISCTICEWSHDGISFTFVHVFQLYAYMQLDTVAV